MGVGSHIEKDAGVGDDASERICVLLVEDDRVLAKFTARYLETQGCQVTLAGDLAEAEYALAEHAFDLVLLDRTLPDGDGLSLCKRIREDSTIPVIVVSGHTDAWDCVAGLEVGADDYVTKPFAPHELMARIKARVRRRRGQVGPNSGLIELGPLALRLADRSARIGDDELRLTGAEFQLLWLLALRTGTALRRDQLVHGLDICERSVDVHVSRIRSKLAASDAEKPIPQIRSVRGVGYLLAHPIPP